MRFWWLAEELKAQRNVEFLFILKTLGVKHSRYRLRLHQNEVFSAGKSVFWKLLICRLTETEEPTALCIHMLKLHCLSLAKDDGPKWLQLVWQMLNTSNSRKLM